MTAKYAEDGQVCETVLQLSTRRAKQMRFDERNGILRQLHAAGSGCPRVGELL